MNAYPSPTPARRPLAEMLHSINNPISFTRTPTPSLNFSLLSSVSSLNLTLPEPPPRVLTREQLNTAMFRHDPEYPYPPPSPRQPSAFARIIPRSDPEAVLSFPGRIFQLTDVRHAYTSPIRVGSYVHLRSGLHEGCVTIIKTWEWQLNSYHVLLAEEEESRILMLLLLVKVEEKESGIVESLMAFISRFIC